MALLINEYRPAECNTQVDSEHGEGGPVASTGHIWTFLPLPRTIFVSRIVLYYIIYYIYTNTTSYYYITISYSHCTLNCLDPTDDENYNHQSPRLE